LIRAGTGLSSSLEPRRAAREAVAAALAEADLESAESAFLIVSSAWGDAIPQIVAAGADALGSEAVVGCSAHGVLAAGQEIEHNPAVAVLALAGVEAVPFSLEDLAGEERHAGEEVRAQLGGDSRPGDLAVVFPDPHRVLAEPLLAALRESLPHAVAVGAAAAERPGAGALTWCGGELCRAGATGMVLRASRPPQVSVTSACRILEPTHRVSRVQGNWILALDERAALEVYREVAGASLSDDPRRASRGLMLALLGSGESAGPRPAGAPPPRLRNVIGLDDERGAFASAEPVGIGERVALALLDPLAAREDLKRVLALVAPQRPDFGLYLGCRARGHSLFGFSGLEAGYLDQGLGGAPLLGLQSAYQIGPRQGRPGADLLTYSGVLALVDSGA